ncbi:MAG TPA: diphosphomevalonate decarboxylase [Polyangiaceae bacterium]
MSAAQSIHAAGDEAVAIAHPNVALSKYWGKREGEGNVPAVPSLSVTLAGLTTRTRVRWDAALAEHRFALDGTPRTRAEAPRVFALLDEVRAGAHADVDSHNDFPTASGLASSASGFAALAVAAAGGAGAWDLARLADVARRGSASAARSLFGGFVEMDGTSVRPVAAVDHMPLAVLVCVTTQAPKAVGSTDGMRRTLAKSPYAAAWLDAAPRLHAELRAALLARDFPRVGELAEASALAMHASAIAAGVVYWNGATIDALAAVHALRAKGTAAYATIDAGPHVKVLVQPADVPAVRAAMGGVPGVLRILEAGPGEGAHLEVAS